MLNKFLFLSAVLLSGCQMALESNGSLSSGETVTGTLIADSSSINRLQLNLPNQVICSGKYQTNENNTRTFPLMCTDGTTGTAAMEVSNKGQPNEAADTQFQLTNGMKGKVHSNRAGPARSEAAMEKKLVSAPTKVSSADISKIKQQVVSQLVDPESVMWGPKVGAALVTDTSTYTSVTTFRVICGTVNAKNRMGGYNGFQAFMAKDEGAGFRLTPFSDYNAFLCAEYGIDVQ